MTAPKAHKKRSAFAIPPESVAPVCLAEIHHQPYKLTLNVLATEHEFTAPRLRRYLFEAPATGWVVYGEPDRPGLEISAKQGGRLTLTHQFDEDQQKLKYHLQEAGAPRLEDVLPVRQRIADAVSQRLIPQVMDLVMYRSELTRFEQAAERVEPTLWYSGIAAWDAFIVINSSAAALSLSTAGLNKCFQNAQQSR